MFLRAPRLSWTGYRNKINQDVPMAISPPKHEPTMCLSCAKCKWSGTTKDLNDVEGFTCPKCAEPLFPPEWLNSDNS